MSDATLESENLPGPVPDDRAWMSDATPESENLPAPVTDDTAAAGARVLSAAQRRRILSLMGYAALQAARRDELRLLRREQIRQLRSQRGIVTGIALEGWCEPRRTPLEHTDLWIAGEGPPEQLPVEEHHKCGICYNVKSHPVSYLCGHSHCYVCICMWLEHQWTCPECVTPMYRAPFRHWAEEAGIERAYPNWNDGSTVNYSWKGLLFPQAPKVLVPATP